MRVRTLLCLATLLALLAGCQPESPRSASDVFLYGDAPRRLTFFYGGPGELAYEGGTLTLTEAPANDQRRAADVTVRSSLLVDGKPHLSAPLQPLEAAPAVARRIPLTTDMQLTVSQDVGEVVYYDGSSYLTLVPDGTPGVTQRVVPRPRLNGLRGIGQLTNEEADALAASFEGRGPFVLVELEPSTLPTHAIDGLAEHRRTGLYVQHEITTDEGAYRPAPEQLTWETLASGAQATGVTSARFELISNRQQLVSFWSRVHASQLQPPPVPDVDFSRETLVAIYQGQKASGGYSVQARRVAVEQGELYVDVEFVEPAPGAMTTTALTSPWTLVRVLRAGYPVVWVRDAVDGTLLGVARRTD
jgi:hypothetical protein